MSDRQSSSDPGRDLWLRLVRQCASDPRSLNEEELTYFAVCLMDGEIFINGIAGYFESASGDLYETALRGLAVIGASDYLTVVQRGKNLLFGDAEVPIEQAQRDEIMRNVEARNDEGLEAELKDIGRQLFALSHDLGARLETYAREHGFWPEGR